MTTILIADDHALIRNGLRQLLSKDFPNAVVGEAESGSDTISQLKKQHWDLLILDINMPDRSGTDILKHVRSTHPHTPVLVLSGFSEKQYGVNVLRAGASGYVSKEMASEELIGAVKCTLRGRRYISSSLAEQLVDGLDADVTAPIHSSLSDREFQIFCKLAAGQSVSDMASELCISVKTVSTYRSRILEKMAFTSNADITTYALRNQLIQ